MTPSDTQQYLRTWTKLANFYIEGRLDEALAVATELEAVAPDRRSFSAHIRACLLSVVGREAEALDLMKEIVAEGKWWLEGQLEDPDFESIRQHPQFSALAAEMTELKKAAESGSGEPQLRVFAADGNARAILVALHMYGITAEETAIPWQPATAAGATVMVVQSSQRDADGNPMWDNSEIADRDVGLAVSKAKEEAGDDVPVLFGGASQGAGVAMRSALTGSVAPSRGFVAVVGSSDVSQLDQFLDRAAHRGVRGAMIAGAEDRFSLGQLQAARDALVERGIPIHFEEMPGVGHWYPDDFDERLERALDFLLS